MTIGILAPHTGDRCAPVPLYRRLSLAPLAALIPSFLRTTPAGEDSRAALQPPRRAAHPHQYERPDGVITVKRGRVTVHPHPRHASTERVHAGGRLLGDLPRRKPMVDRQPWQTMALPVLDEPRRPEMIP